MTRRQHKTYVFIRDYIGAHGYSPSFGDIMEGVGYASKSNVFYALERLQNRGLIRRHSHRARSIEILPQTDELSELKQEIARLRLALQELCKPIPMGMLANPDYEGALREANRRQRLASEALSQ